MFSLGPDETAQFRVDGIVLENANRIGVSITAATGRETVTQTSDQLVGIRGDLDQDGVVGFADFLTLRENFGIREKATPAEGDLNFDGAVNFPDFLLFSLNFGSSKGKRTSLPRWVPAKVSRVPDGLATPQLSNPWLIANKKRPSLS